MKRVRKITPEGMLIKMLMIQNNMTVKELAKRIGKSDATICDVVSGKNKSRETLKLIIEALQENGSADISEYQKFFMEQIDG
ncbi:MAG: helix-turn-helix domain-containing protein [Clostridiales bacterium]|nr:helix-turn-helix domain-containing protein [Clostridiales bacterium]MCD8084603.1 helix-turn-helix domain-containing protein [Clostridiales bacterium]